jgi:uncharacterized protein YegJ (DUF2314 family)
MHSGLNAAQKTLMVATVVAAGAVLSSCKDKPQEKPVISGSPMSLTIDFRFAVFMVPTAEKDPQVALAAAIGKYSPNLKHIADIPEKPIEMVVKAQLLKNAAEKYPPPTAEELKYSGFGLSKGQVVALQQSKQVFILEFAHPKERVWEALRAANLIVEQVAGDTKGLIWDEETQDMFTPEAWEQRRLSKWSGVTPNIETQISVQSYQKGEFVRGVSQGMKKAGLPDVVVEDFDWSSESQVVDLINLFCQTMAEGASLSIPGKFRLDLKEIKDTDARESELRSLKLKGIGVGYLQLKTGTVDKGDPENRLIELASDRYDGNDPQSKKQRLLSCFFGSDDVATNVEHTDEVLEASRKARTQLPSLSEKFNAGLEPGEFIQVKAPFKTPDGGREWMWVEITHWKNKRIRGVLENDPVLIPELRSGEVVEIREDDVFDYIHRFSDGHREGNTTGEIIKKMEKTPSLVKPKLTLEGLAKRISDSGCTPN